MGLVLQEYSQHHNLPGVLFTVLAGAQAADPCFGCTHSPSVLVKTYSRSSGQEVRAILRFVLGSAVVIVECILRG